MGSLNLLHQVLAEKAPHLKCFYTNACSMRNKQEELEPLAHSQRFGILGISES